MTYGYQINKDEMPQKSIDKLQEYLDKYKSKEYKETPLLDNFSNIARLISQNYDNDVFKATLLIMYDVCLRKELNHIDRSASFNSSLSQSSNFRSGIDCMNFLFDVINEISGYTEKYYDEMRDKIDHEGLVKKYRKEKTFYDSSKDASIQDSSLLGDHYPHSLMVIE